jgi:P4 family phage/plasmid primase-like protien
MSIESVEQGQESVAGGILKAKSNEPSEMFLAKIIIDKFKVEVKERNEKKPKTVRTIRFFGDNFYVWKDKKWERLTKEEFQSDYIVQELADTGGLSSSKINLVTTCMVSLLRRIGQGAVPFNSWTTPRGEVIATIPMHNGLVTKTWLDDHEKDPDSKLKWSFEEATPNYFSLNKLPYDYEQYAICPKWEKFIEQITCGNKQRARILQQWAGYLLMQGPGEQKFLLYYGEGANGKGVFANVMRAMLGAENVSNVGLDDFKNKYAVASMLGKLANMSNESSRGIKGQAENILKTLTGGDAYTFEAKYKDPTPAVPTAKVMISTNELPKFSDRSRGTWRRVILVPFEMDLPLDQLRTNLQAELEEELIGIFNWALLGLVDVYDNGFALPDEHKRLIESYRQEADPARDFLTEFYVYKADNEFGVRCDTFYTAYNEWAKKNGFMPVSITSFNRQVVRVFPEAAKKRVRIKGTKNMEYRWIGIGRNYQV